MTYNVLSWTLSLYTTILWLLKCQIVAKTLLSDKVVNYLYMSVICFMLHHLLIHTFIIRISLNSVLLPVRW